MYATYKTQQTEKEDRQPGPAVLYFGVLTQWPKVARVSWRFSPRSSVNQPFSAFSEVWVHADRYFYFSKWPSGH
jgi:hypothetical protein